MQITTLRSDETSVAQLIGRLYPRLSESQRASIQLDLLNANPHLRQPGAMAAGVVVRVPRIPGVRWRPGDKEEDAPLRMGTLLQRELREHQLRLRQHLQERQVQIRQQQELLKQADVGAAIEQSDGAAEIAKGLQRSLSDRREALTRSGQTQNELIRRISKDVDQLLNG